MTSVSDMVNNFLQAEEKNFSLFNFVNELNRRVWAHARLGSQCGRFVDDPQTNLAIVAHLPPPA